MRTPEFCLLCGCGTLSRRCSVPERACGKGESFDILECSACGFMQTSPRPEGAELAAYYPDSYAPHTATWRGPLFGGKPVRDGLKREIFRLWYGYFGGPRGGALEAVEKLLLGPLRFIWLVPPAFTPGGRLLDVGCGAGEFLAFVRDLGWTVVGLESKASAAEEAKRVFGLDIRAGTLESLSSADGPFDVVSLWHVLEHVADPDAALKSARRALKPGGYILAGIPNAACWEARLFGPHWLQWDPPRHLWHFTPANLERLARRCGLRVSDWHTLPGSGDAVVSLQFALADRGWGRLAKLPGWGLLRLLLSPIGWLARARGAGGRLIARLEPL